MKVFKRPIPVPYYVLGKDVTIETLEGPVSAGPGQVVLTGVDGEQYPISREVFERSYGKITGKNGVAHKRRIHADAVELKEPTRVKVSWSDDYLRGRPGDYLVTHPDGGKGIVARHIFEKTYAEVKTLPPLRVITCPEEFPYKGPTFPNLFIFMAGGITGCPDWQSAVIEYLKQEFDNRSYFDYQEVVLLNPRRSSFDITQKSMSEQQIQWEEKGLDLVAHQTFFWFPKEALCPITLFELGKALPSFPNFKVGVEPGYARDFDVRFQLDLKFSNKMEVWEDLFKMYSTLIPKQPT